jgi:hypothetical protein
MNTNTPRTEAQPISWFSKMVTGDSHRKPALNRFAVAAFVVLSSPVTLATAAERLTHDPVPPAK